MPPGQPENPTITLTSSRCASGTVFRKHSRPRAACFSSGCTGLPWQLSVATRIPRSSNFFFQTFAFAASASNSSIGQWPVPGYPPVPISMASRPNAFTRSSISSSERWSYTGSNTPIGIFRSEPLADCGDLADEDPCDALDPAGPAPFGGAGIAAASKLPLVAARNCLRSIPSDLTFLRIRESPQRGCAAADNSAALYDALLNLAL